MCDDQIRPALRQTEGELLSTFASHNNLRSSSPRIELRADDKTSPRAELLENDRDSKWPPCEEAHARFVRLQEHRVYRFDPTRLLETATTQVRPVVRKVRDVDGTCSKNVQ